MANNMHPVKIPSNKRVVARAKMARADRAKQFMPFDALTGLQDLLQEMVLKDEYVEEKILADDQIKLLDQKLQEIKAGDLVRVKYIQNGQALEHIGCVSKISSSNQYLQLVTTLIDFRSIYELELL